jgi:hypothetical protein
VPFFNDDGSHITSTACFHGQNSNAIVALIHGRREYIFTEVFFVSNVIALKRTQSYSSVSRVGTELHNPTV